MTANKSVESSATRARTIELEMEALLSMHDNFDDAGSEYSAELEDDDEIPPAPPVESESPRDVESRHFRESFVGFVKDQSKRSSTKSVASPRPLLKRNNSAGRLSASSRTSVSNSPRGSVLLSPRATPTNRRKRIVQGRHHDADSPRSNDGTPSSSPASSPSAIRTPRSTRSRRRERMAGEVGTSSRRMAAASLPVNLPMAGEDTTDEQTETTISATTAETTQTLSNSDDSTDGCEREQRRGSRRGVSRSNSHDSTDGCERGDRRRGSRRGVSKSDDDSTDGCERGDRRRGSRRGGERKSMTTEEEGQKSKRGERKSTTTNGEEGGKSRRGERKSTTSSSSHHRPSSRPTSQ